MLGIDRVIKLPKLQKEVPELLLNKRPKTTNPKNVQLHLASRPEQDRDGRPSSLLLRLLGGQTIHRIPDHSDGK